MSTVKKYSVDFTGQYQEYFSVSHEEKNDYLAVAARSVNSFLKTGMRDSALEEFVEREEKFRANYASSVKLEGLFHQNLQKAFFYAIDTAQEEALKEVSVKGAANVVEPTELYVKMCNRSLRKQWENLRMHLKDAFENIAYMGKIQELYEIYHQENETRKAERKFEEDLGNYQGLESIVVFLSENGRTQIDVICKATRLKRKDVEHILRDCSDYFSIKKIQGVWTVVLNVGGRQLDRYLSSIKKPLSNEELYDAFENALVKLERALDNEKRDGFVTQVFDTDYLTSLQRKMLNRKFDKIISRRFRLEDEVYAEYKVVGDENMLDYDEEGENGREAIRFTR